MSGRLRLESIPRFVRFALVGCAGYLVDVGALYVALYLLGTGFYLGRLFSYLCASSSTWYMNRLFTFADASSANRTSEWLRFVLLNAIGGLVNYTVSAVYVHYESSSTAAPAVAVALGSLAGLCVNYFLSHRLVFRSAVQSQSPP